MLTWRRVDGQWLGNGFRIERLSHRAWGLFEAPVPEDRSQVVAETGPIASLPSLQACQYKAEHIHRSNEQAMVRVRLAAVAAGGTAAALLFISQPLLAIALGVIAASATLEFAMTWFEARAGGAREFTQ